MAIYDKLNTFCASTEAGAHTTEAALGDVIDWTATYGPGGGDQPFWLMVHFHSVGTPNTATTWILNCYTDADGTIPTSGSLVASRTFAITTEIVAGTTYYIPIAGGPSRWLRYLGLADDADAIWTTGPTVTCALCVNPNTAQQ